MFQGGCYPLCACTRVNIITHVHASWWMSQLCACSRVDVTTCVHVPGWMLPAGADGEAEARRGGDEVCDDATGVQTPSTHSVQTRDHSGQ